MSAVYISLDKFGLHTIGPGIGVYVVDSASGVVWYGDISWRKTPDLRNMQTEAHSVTNDLQTSLETR